MTMTRNANAPCDTRNALAAWLVVVAALVCVMIVVGGLTRLTDSGLSITEWKPITGAAPPMSEAAWREAFAKYQAIPEYQLQNRGMALADFKVIYWWEWGHRQLGRVIGLVYAAPLVGFWLAGRLPRRLRGRFVGLLVFGGLQGAIGWWMVASGLTERVDVSHYRLAVHLGMAFLLLAALVWTLLDVVDDRPQRRGWGGDAIAIAATALAAGVFLQIILGAFVAGLDAGRIYTDWPLMDGAIIPADYGALEPWWRDALENRASVQLHHRFGGYLVALGAVSFAAAAWRAGIASRVSIALGAVTLAQAALGVATLMHAAPLSLSAAHQAMAVALFILAVAAARQSRVAARYGAAAKASTTVSSAMTLNAGPSATTSAP